MLQQRGVTNPSYKYFTHKNTKITCNMKCSYLGTFELFQASKSRELALLEARTHQNTSSLLSTHQSHNKSVSQFVLRFRLSGSSSPCAIFIHQRQQTPEQENLIWLYEIISVIFMWAIRLNWSIRFLCTRITCEITCSSANSACFRAVLLPEMLRLTFH